MLITLVMRSLSHPSNDIQVTLAMASSASVDKNFAKRMIKTHLKIAACCANRKCADGLGSGSCLLLR